MATVKKVEFGKLKRVHSTNSPYALVSFSEGAKGHWGDLDAATLLSFLISESMDHDFSYHVFPAGLKSMLSAYFPKIDFTSEELIAKKLDVVLQGANFKTLFKPITATSQSRSFDIELTEKARHSLLANSMALKDQMEIADKGGNMPPMSEYYARATKILEKTPGKTPASWA